MTVTRFAHVEDARAFAAEMFRGHVGELVATSVIPNSRNFLFCMEDAGGRKYVVKVYASTSELIGNCEAVAYDRLKGNTFIRNCLGIHRGQAGVPAWAIFEYIPGSTVLESIDRLQSDPALEQRVVREIVRFVRDCTVIGVGGYGDIDAFFRGEYAAWPDFLKNYLDNLGQSIRKVQDVAVRAQMERGMACLQRFIAGTAEFLQTRPSAFVPVDLNMANFLIGTDERLVALDLENFLAADPLLAVGEWTGHTFGTPRYQAFMVAWGDMSGPESACVRAYALLCNMDVLIYIVNNHVLPASDARPWGNPNRFLDLIDSHIQWLESYA